MAQHTSEEKAKISVAYILLISMAEMLGKGIDLIDRALKLEKRARGNNHTAQALIIREFRNGHDYGAVDLYGMAEGLQLAAMVGAEAYRVFGEALDEKRLRWLRFCEAAEVSIAAHEAAVHRQLERLTSHCAVYSGNVEYDGDGTWTYYDFHDLRDGVCERCGEAVDAAAASRRQARIAAENLKTSQQQGW